MQGGVDHDGLAFLELHLHLGGSRGQTLREKGREAGVGWAGYWVCEFGKRACTVSPETGALLASLPPLQQLISAANRLSSLSKRWPCDVEVGEWPRLAASE